MQVHRKFWSRLAWAASIVAAALFAISVFSICGAPLRNIDAAIFQEAYADEPAPPPDPADYEGLCETLAQQVVPIDSRGLGMQVVQGTDVSKLRPIANGPGIVVCLPRPAGTSQDVTDFADGCGEWLHLIVAGQPDFGKPPAMQSLARSSQELGLKNLELTKAQAANLYRMVGVNYAAVGTVRGAKENCTLSYQIYALPSEKRVGKPIVVSGSEKAILANLPSVASAMVHDLGDSSPQIPVSAGSANPNDFAFLGMLGRTNDIAALPVDQQKRMVALAQRIPLAGVFYVGSTAGGNESHMTAAVKTLFAQLPQNPIVYAYIGWLDTDKLLLYRQTIESAFNKYPKNSLWATAEAYLCRADYQAQKERAASEQAVRCAWHNPDAWRTLAFTISDEGDAIRSGRLSDMISDSEWAYLNENYVQWEESTAQAVELDPGYGKAWERLAVAATFNSDTTVADHAIQAALHLDPDHAEVYGWALQMYQPKWSEDSGQLRKWASLAASDNKISEGDILDVYEDLMDARCTGQATAMLGRYEAKLLKRTSQNSRDGQAHMALGLCYYHLQRFDQAISEYEKAAVLSPDDPDIHYDLALCYELKGQDENAISAYKEVLKRDPDDKDAHYDLAYYLKHENKTAPALSEFEQALRIDPYYADARFGLGELYIMEGHPQLSIPELKKAVLYDPELTNTYIDLALELDNTGQYDQSLQAAYDGLLRDPVHNESINIIEDDFLHLHQYDKALAICNLVLKANVYGGDEQTTASVTHENMAEAYLGKGDTSEAIAQWNTVVSINDPATVNVAKSYLSKYH